MPDYNIDENEVPRNIRSATPGIATPTATVRLTPKDKELLVSNETIDYEAPEHAYLGGRFGTNENDYVEILITEDK